ncbi:MAG: hypothetical protein ACYDBB_04430 [Armatimonadota bacterium]
MRKLWVFLTCLMLFGAAVAEPPAMASGTHLLSEFGKISTPAEADAALEKAAKAMLAEGGGLLIIPKDAPADWDPVNISQEAWRKPEPPAPAKNWGYTGGITILDYRDGTMKAYLPQATGWQFNRTVLFPERQSAGHWGYLPMFSFSNSIIRGTTSYHDWVSQEVKAGKDQRIYVRTLRGLFPGMFVNSLGGGPVNRLYIKSLGYDKEKKAPYVIADVDTNFDSSALLSNKTHANVLRADTYSHTENQTFDFMVMRHNYSQGDNYMFYAGFNYMGDVHSTAGDENGVLYAAFPISESNGFRGQVEAYNPQTADLKYTGATNAHTLGTGRPMINLNPKKWITEGKAYIIHPGGALIGYPDRIRSKDAPWTADVVGRYLAIDEPDEYIPGSNKARRWYYITAFSEKDGVKWISVQRNWWGAKNGNSITRLYNPAHYTNGTDNKNPVLLRYIIAPGANIYDVTRGVKDDGQWGGRYVGGALERIVKVSPGPHVGTAFDFAPGDPIEQAVGFDPFKPIPFRSWMFENVPGAYPAPVFDVANHGQTARFAVLAVDGGSPNYADYTNPQKPLPQIPWNKIIDIQSACENGIAFNGEVADAAILFRQPNKLQQWMRWEGNAWETPMTNLGVNANGDLDLSYRNRGFTGRPGGLDVSGQGLADLKGISGGKDKANNLRGILVSVPAGAQSLDIVFPASEPTDKYLVKIELSWLANRNVTKRTTTGFTIQFDRPAPTKATLDWLVIR